MPCSVSIYPEGVIGITVDGVLARILERGKCLSRTKRRVKPPPATSPPPQLVIHKSAQKVGCNFWTGLGNSMTRREQARVRRELELPQRTDMLRGL